MTMKDVGREPEHGIAIIGLSGIFPSGSSPDRFWENLTAGLDCIRELPANRKEVNDPYVQIAGGAQGDGISYAKRAYLEEIDLFDYPFFHLSPEEASLMDPAQRLFLQTVWHLLEEAGYSGRKLEGTRTGVFYGYSGSAELTYSQMAAELQPEDREQALLGNLISLLPSRISYLMDWRGPSMVVDTAGSSSLVALHQACQSIRLGECDQAVVGTGRVMTVPLDHAASHRPDSGEAVAAVMVKSLKQALADNDHIHAVIRGSAVNQDGRSFAAGGQDAQSLEALLAEAWENAGINPASLSFIEGHGTGESEAELLELLSLHKALTRYGQAPGQCAFTSVASHTGHLQHAAGLTGLVKSVMALKHRGLPPMQRVQASPARQELLKDSPVYYADKPISWAEQQGPLYCGISSFGMGGTNCHMVLEEAPFAGTVDAPLEGTFMLTLSAESEAALSRLIHLYADAVEKLEEADLPHLCYTANTGRGHYRQRIAMLVRRKGELLEKLTRLFSQPLATVKEPGIYYGALTPDHDEAQGDECFEGEWAELCQAYVDGAELAWSRLYDHKRHRRLSLPLYPFEKLRCWVGLKTVESKDFREPAPDPIGTAEPPNRELMAEEAASAAEPAPSIREKVKELFSYYLGFDEMNEEISFYELGGDSIAAVKIVNDINKALQKNATVVDLFKHASISQFSDFLEQMKGEADSTERTVRRQEKRAHYPLSPSQRRLFVMTQFQPELTMYNMPHSVVIEGPLDANRLQAAMNKLIGRHEALRTSFQFVENEPVQVIHDHAEINIEIYPETLDEAEIRNAQRAFTRTFNLATPPLMRAALARLGTDRHVCFLDMHHIVSDGSSMAIFMKELMHYYEFGSELEPLSIQYADYSVWLNEQAASGHQDKLREFWLGKFADRLPVLPLPTDYGRADRRRFEGAQIELTLGKEHTELLYQFSRKTGATTYVILLAVYHLLFTKYSGQEDIIIGTWVQGRPVKELNELIGMFVQTIPMRNRCSREMTFAEFIRQVQDNTLQAFEHQDYPFEDLVNGLNVKRDLSRNPLFDVAFSLQNMDKPVMASPSLRMELLPTHNDIALFDITLYVHEGEDGLTSKWEYDASLFHAETIMKWGNDYFGLLASLLNLPDAPLGDHNGLIFEKQLEVENVEFLF